jgi:hypothetical protein
MDNYLLKIMNIIDPYACPLFALVLVIFLVILLREQIKKFFPRVSEIAFETENKKFRVAFNNIVKKDIKKDVESSGVTLVFEQKLEAGDLTAWDIVLEARNLLDLPVILEQELKRIPVGRVVFNPPDEMRVGVRERIEVRISKDLDAEMCFALKGRGVVQIEDIKVSELMKVRMSGSDFDITSLNEEEQFIGSQGFTEWVWDIIPQKSGNKVLHLHVTLRIRLPHGEERKDHPVLDKSVLVKVNHLYSTKVFVITYWKWIATAIILPMMGFIWKTFIK